MEHNDTRTQAEIDADIAQLRAELISVINPRQAYWLRGIAFTLDTSPSAVFNGLLNDAQPLLDLADAALAFTAHPDPDTVSALTAAADAMRASWAGNSRPRDAGIAAVKALGKLHGA